MFGEVSPKLKSYTFITKQFSLLTGSNQAFALDSEAAFPYVIDSVRGLMTSSGTITATLQINSTSVIGCTALIASTTSQDATARSANFVNIGNRLTVLFGTNTSALNVEMSVVARRIL